MKSKLILSLGAAAATLVAAPSVVTAQAAAPGYHVIHRINAGGEGGWDYITVDPESNRLFLSRGTHAMVIDLGRDSVIGDIPNTLGIHGVALAPELNRGFTSNGRDSSVTIFDYKTLATIAVVKIPGRNPDAILYDPATKRVFTFNGGSSNSTAIDATNGKVLGTVELGGKPETAVSEGGKIYANIEDKSEIAVFDPATQLAFTSNGEGSITVVHEDTPDKYTVVETVPTQRGARTMAVNPKTHRLYTVSAEFGPAPAPTADRPRPRPPMIPGTFVVLELDR